MSGCGGCSTTGTARTDSVVIGSGSVRVLMAILPRSVSGAQTAHLLWPRTASPWDLDQRPARLFVFLPAAFGGAAAAARATAARMSVLVTIPQGRLPSATTRIR